MRNNFRSAALGLVAVGIFLAAAGCASNDLNNDYDASKLPPKPTDGRGPQAGGAAAGGGGDAAKTAAPAKATTAVP
jgi:hypothetical protein